MSLVEQNLPADPPSVKCQSQQLKPLADQDNLHFLIFDDLTSKARLVSSARKLTPAPKLLLTPVPARNLLPAKALLSWAHSC